MEKLEKVKPFGTKRRWGDLVESAFFDSKGLLAVREYYKGGTLKKRSLHNRNIECSGGEMDWDFSYQRWSKILLLHWVPNFAWDMNFALEGYNETFNHLCFWQPPHLTHSISPEAYHQSWARIMRDQSFGFVLLLVFLSQTQT